MSSWSLTPADQLELTPAISWRLRRWYKLEFNSDRSAGVDSGHQLALAPVAMQILSNEPVFLLSQLVRAPAGGGKPILGNIILDI